MPLCPTSGGFQAAVYRGLEASNLFPLTSKNVPWAGMPAQHPHLPECV